MTCAYMERAVCEVQRRLHDELCTECLYKVVDLMPERWATEDDRWCEVCQQDDDDGDGNDPRETMGIMPLTVPTPAFPFRVCADCAVEWDEMMADEERHALGLP